MDKNLSKTSKILILGQIALIAVIYFKQAFVFFKLINKSLL